MCVGRCHRLLFVCAVVVYREVLLLPSSLRTIVPAQRSERGSGLEKEVKLKGGASGLFEASSAGKAVVDLPGEKLNLSAQSLPFWQ